MRLHHTLARLYLDKALSLDAYVELDKTHVHYLATVLRKRDGDDLCVFNSRDGEWRAQIEQIEKKRVTLKLVEQLRTPKPCPDIWICFAPIRKHRTAFIVEKATELGASALLPTVTQFTQFPKLNTEKMTAQVIEAAEQTERLDLPQIMPSQKLEDLIATWPKGRALIFADEAAAGGKTCFDIKTLEALPAPCALLIGPEGGFSPQERELLLAQSFVTPISLGPRILRADTAALSLLALWQAVNGDW